MGTQTPGPCTPFHSLLRVGPSTSSIHALGDCAPVRGRVGRVRVRRAPMPRPGGSRPHCRPQRHQLLPAVRGVRALSALSDGALIPYEIPGWQEMADLQDRHLFNLKHAMHCLRPGVVIYVTTSWLDLFFDAWYDKIPVPFVLVSGGASDDPAPQAAHRAKLLDPASKILHWYAQNCQGTPLPRFSCVPIGTDASSYWTIGTKEAAPAVVLLSEFSSSIVTSASYSRTPHSPAYDVLVPGFNMGTHPARTVVWTQLCSAGAAGAPHTTPSNLTVLCLSRTDVSSMLAHTRRSAFVVSPHGHGLDCYRTWETLYLGSYPIVTSSSLDELYQDLPVLILQTWEQLTPTLLAETHFRFSRTAWRYERLRPAYWSARFASHPPPSTSSTSPSAPTHYDYSSLSQSATYSAETLKRLGLSGGDLITSEKTLFYLLDQNTRRHIPDLATFLRHGWEFADAHRLSEEDLNAIRVGPDVD
mmetsp:Transcript_8353/g.18329  ORF Transcript_8353/g.18329 Transcript_8353/m.18329 type:complete len:472 (-) Transcript_8353:1667-3082(-)